MQVKIIKTPNGQYMVTARRGDKTTREAVGKNRRQLAQIYRAAGHEVVRAWS
jgi:hypothetical protein